MVPGTHSLAWRVKCCYRGSSQERTAPFCYQCSTESCFVWAQGVQGQKVDIRSNSQSTCFQLFDKYVDRVFLNYDILFHCGSFIGNVILWTVHLQRSKMRRDHGSCEQGNQLFMLIVQSWKKVVEYGQRPSYTSAVDGTVLKRWQLLAYEESKSCTLPTSVLWCFSSLIYKHFICRIAKAWYPTRPGIWRMHMLLTSSLALIGMGFNLLTGSCPYVLLQPLWGNLKILMYCFKL
jgi:hypothetical protein